MTHSGLAETIIENEVGCGPFQVLIVLFVFIFLRISAVFTFIFMCYGNYNPGWRCLDNQTLYHDTNGTRSVTGYWNPVNKSQPYRKDLSCEDYAACGNVEFNPESSTVVTEWNLICDRAWISSFLISIQMTGNLLASFVSGYVADRVGRRKTLYGSLFINAVVICFSALSNSWLMLAGFRFFVGVTSAFFESLIYMYPSEFLTRKWRGPLSGVPGWAIGGIIFGLTSMLLKDWRNILVASSIVCLLAFLPVFWVPESLRWLEVKGENEQFKRAAKKMAEFNGKQLHEKHDEVFTLQNQATDALNDKSGKKQYTILDLFRPGYRLITFIVGFVWLSLSFIYYAIGFGIKALSGDFYVNLILLYAILIPFAIFPFFAPNLLGRTKSSCLFMAMGSVCLLSATAFELWTTGSTRTIGTLALVLTAAVGVETTWCIQQVQTNEIYPTVVRGLGINWASLMARVGGIVAPFLIPRDSSTVYAWYLMMGCQGLICCCLLSKLTETRGKALKETFSTINISGSSITVDTSESSFDKEKEELPKGDNVS